MKNKRKKFDFRTDNYLKLIVYNNQNLMIHELGGFGGEVKNGVPQLWHYEGTQFSKDNEIAWLTDKWNDLATKDPSVSRGYILEKNCYDTKQSIRTFENNAQNRIDRTIPEFRFALRIKEEKGKYQTFYTAKERWEDCLIDLKNQYLEFRKEEINFKVVFSMVLGDGYFLYKDLKTPPEKIKFFINTLKFWSIKTSSTLL